jgi:hypothetical protein
MSPIAESQIRPTGRNKERGGKGKERGHAEKQSQAAHKRSAGPSTFQTILGASRKGAHVIGLARAPPPINIEPWNPLTGGKPMPTKDVLVI